MTSRLPLVTSTRGLAAQAAGKRLSVAANPAALVSKGSNGLTIATIETNSPLVTLGVGVKAGSRNETAENRGIAQVLKNCASLSTKTQSLFATRQQLGALGAQLDVTADRELIYYSTTVLRENASAAAEYFLNAISGQSFKPWEINDHISPINKEVYEIVPEGGTILTSTLSAELSAATPQQRAQDLLFQAAFRTGLGNSFIAPSWTIGSHTSAMLQAYYNKTFTNERAILVAVGGVGNLPLSDFASILELENGAGPSSKSQYFGGEIRQEGGGNNAAVAIGAQAAGVASPSDAIAFYVLQRAVGAGSRVKRGGATSPVSAAVEAAGAQSEVFYEAYSDAGLFGVTVSGTASNIGKATTAAVAALRSLNVTAEQVEAAKKTMLQESSDINCSTALRARDAIVMGLNLNGQIMAQDDITAAISNVSLGEVQAAAKKIAGGKLSLASVGAISEVPYLDTL